MSHVEALDQIDEWLAAPPAVVIEPTVDHPRIVRQLLKEVDVAGDLLMDTHLAALSIEHKCVVVSYDNDFDRFEGVRREQPA